MIQKRRTSRVWTLQDTPLLERQFGNRYEIVTGTLMLREAPGVYHGSVAARICALLFPYVDEQNLGHVLSETDFILSRDPDTILRPDIAFVAGARVPMPMSEEFFPGAPDLAIEVASPSNRHASIEAKVALYLAAGTRMVWDIDPATQAVRIWRADGTMTHLGASDWITGETVIPGWNGLVERFFFTRRSPAVSPYTARERVGGWPPE